MHAYKEVIFIIRAKFIKYFKQDKFNCCNCKRVIMLFTNYNKVTNICLGVNNTASGSLFSEAQALFSQQGLAQ